MTREERGSTRKTGYRAGGVAVLTAALCLADAAHAQLRGAEPGWAGRPAPESTEAANDGRYRIRLAPLTSEKTGGYDLTLTGDARPARAGFGGFAERETGENRVRLTLEGSRAFALDRGRALTSSLAAGLRGDRGEAGLDLGGGLSFADRSSGVSVDLRAHGLAAPDDGDRKWGASGALRLAPDARGRGLSLSFLPWWADDADEAERPWPPGSASLLAPEDHDAGLEAEVGYGLDAFDGRGVLTPYMGVSEVGRGREIHGGVRVSFAAIQGAISGATEKTAASDPDRHSVGVSMRMPLGAHPAGAASAPPPEWMTSAVPLSAAVAEPAAPRRIPASPGPRARTAALEAPAPEPPAPETPENDAPTPDRTGPAIPPAPPRAADGPRYRVQLGAFSRPADAGRARTALAGALEDVLAGGGRALVVDASGSDGLSRVVLSDSFAGRRAATAVCAKIAARGRDCYVARAR